MSWQRLPFLLALFFVGWLIYPSHGQIRVRVSGSRPGWRERLLPKQDLVDPTPTPVPTPIPSQTLAQMAHDFESMWFANPRGLPYHDVEVVLEKRSGYPRAYVPQSIARTRGWILPGQRTFIAWNGWVYPLYKLGGKADWRTDALRLIEHRREDEAQRQKKKSYFGGGYIEPIDAKPQIISWSSEYLYGGRRGSLWFNSLDKFKVVMLELLGEARLAQRLWDICDTDMAKRARWQEQNRTWRRPKPGLIFPTLPYRFEQAPSWVHMGYEEATRLIRDGDDVAALSKLRILAQACDVIGVNDRIDSDNIRQLRDDCERRVTEKGIPQDTNSMAFLIWDLQNVGIYTQTEIQQDARFRRIVARGDEAIEPLIQTLSSDQRISRQVTPWINVPLPVWEVATQALSEILHNDYDWIFHEIHFNDLEVTDEEVRIITAGGNINERKVLAGIVQSDWEKVRGIPPLERPYETLRNDAAGKDEWWKAAQLIVKQERDYWTPGTPWWGWKPKPMWGEQLRSKRNPSISELLAWRSDESARLPKENSKRNTAPNYRIKGSFGNSTDSSVALALALHTWDENASAPVLLARLRELSVTDENGKSDSSYQRNLLRLLDAAPKEEGDLIYANWLRALPRIEMSFDVFRPLWQRYKKPLWQKTATDLFESPTSPWSSILSASTPLEDARKLDYGRNLIVVPAWNRLLRRDLRNKSVVGTIKLNVRKELYLEDEAKQTWSPPLSKEESERAKSMSPQQPLRLCDLIACALFSKGSRNLKWPPFSITTSEKKRDAQIQKIIAWVATRSGKTSRALGI